jgi:hypothetical protein
LGGGGLLRSGFGHQIKHFESLNFVASDEQFLKKLFGISSLRLSLDL